MKYITGFSRNLQLGLENVMMHKLRSLLTILGIVFGVASVIAMLSIGEGASRQALDQIRRLGSHNIIITSEKEPESAGGDQTQRKRTLSYGLTYHDFDRLRQTFPTITEAAPQKIINKKARCGSRSTNIRLIGTNAGYFDLVKREMLAGRVLCDTDIARRHPVAVISESVARRLLPDNYAVGSSLVVGQNIFDVVGVVRDVGGPVAGGGVDGDNDVYVPLSTLRERYGDVDFQISNGSFKRESVELHRIVVRVDRLDRVEATAAAIKRMLRTAHKKQDYRMHIPLALLRQARETQRTFSIVLGSIACISLLVGGIGIMNIMLASVTERTREIGVRRAIGARRRQITEQFLTETVVLSATGGILGTMLGVAIPFAISRLTGMPTIVTGWSVALSLVISVAIGIIFGIYPAIRAANLDPIEALRHE